MEPDERRCSAWITPFGVTMREQAEMAYRCPNRAMLGIHAPELCEVHVEALAGHLRVVRAILAFPPRSGRVAGSS